MDPNYQKTHYFLDTTQFKRRRIANPLFGVEDLNTHDCVFTKLSEETDDDVKHRFHLYEKVWSHQKSKIEQILGSANNELFEDLIHYIHTPLSLKLDIAFLSLSTNTANNLRILDEFSSNVVKNTQADNTHIRIVRLSSKVCFNGKAAIKEVVKQVLEDPKDHGQTLQNGNAGDYNLDQDDEDDATVKEAANDEADELDNPSDGDGDDGDDGDDGASGKISYDFEIVEDWVQNYIKKHKCEDSFRIVVIFDDADSFQNEILNLLLQLFCVYRLKCPMKIVMGLISKNASSWINNNVTSKLRNLLLGVRLEAKDNKNIGFRVINEILLQNTITQQNPLLVSAHLSLIILNRFENTNNSIDSLITELKLSYMTYFYQLHLSTLLDPEFVAKPYHYDGLRKLSSFKTHVEYFLHEFIKTSDDKHKTYLCNLLEDDSKLSNLFRDARMKFQQYQNTVMNAVNVVYWLCDHRKEKFEVYKLITNNQLINSPFLTDLLKTVKSFDEKKSSDFVDFLSSDNIHPDLEECSDPDVKNLKNSIAKDSNRLLDSLTDYFHQNHSLNMKISDNLFHEVLTITGGSNEFEEQIPKFSIEENFENLMINLIRPKLREIIESALEEPQKYLRNSILVQKLGTAGNFHRILGPALPRFYQIYKDAPVNINLWDFYTAFKQSLLKREIVDEIEENYKAYQPTLNPILGEYVSKLRNSEEAWDKMTFSWFIQSCYELSSMGFMRDKSKGNYMEKMIWRNL